MTKLEAGARAVGSSIGRTEAAVTIAVIESARNVAAIVDAFAEAGVAIEIEQEAVEMALATLTSAIAGRRQTMELHRRLSAIGRKLEIDPRAHGDCDDYKKLLAPSGGDRGRPPLAAVA